MTDEAMRLLRQRMMEDMRSEIAAIRRIAGKAHEGYIHTVNDLNDETGALKMQ